jgi:hypothetical protein
MNFIAQSLEFDLIVYAPYRSVEGFVADIEASLTNPSVFVIPPIIQNEFAPFLAPLYLFFGELLIFSFDRTGILPSNR